MRFAILVITLALLFLFYFKKASFNLTGNRFKTVKGKRSFPGIDMVYVISMPQRKEYITEQIDKLGVTCTYFDAVKPADLTTSDYDTLSSINDPKSKIYKKYTRLPVLLSFVMCFMDALSKGYKNIVLFEDDIKMTTSISTLNSSLSEFNKSDCDVFYMGYCYLNCKNPIKQLFNSLVEISDRDLLCCHSMSIKTRILPALINYCFPMNFNSDELFRNFYISKGIHVCVPKKVYFEQNRETVESLNESFDGDELFKTCIFTS